MAPWLARATLVASIAIGSAASLSTLDASVATAAPAATRVTVIKDPERRKLVEAVQLADRTLDASQGDAWAQDGTFQIASNPEVKGREAIKAFLAGFFGMKLFTKIEHRMVDVVELRDKLIYNAVVTYTLPGGDTVVSSYVNWITFKREGKALKFETYRVFIDTTPLMAKSNMGRK
jgi:hypothetical protein